MKSKILLIIFLLLFNREKKKHIDLASCCRCRLEKVHKWMICFVWVFLQLIFRTRVKRRETEKNWNRIRIDLCIWYGSLKIAFLLHKKANNEKHEENKNLFYVACGWKNFFERDVELKLITGFDLVMEGWLDFWSFSILIHLLKALKNHKK